MTNTTGGAPAGRRTSLLVRMGNAAREAGVVVRRIHLVVAIDRLLVRLLAAAPGRWVVKGGYANQLRRPDDARFTEDLDLKIDAAIETAPELLASGFAVDLADDFSYEVAAAPVPLEGPPGGGLRFVVVARLAGTELVRFKVAPDSPENRTCEDEAWAESEHESWLRTAAAGLRAAPDSGSGDRRFESFRPSQSHNMWASCSRRHTASGVIWPSAPPREGGHNMARAPDFPDSRAPDSRGLIVSERKRCATSGGTRAKQPKLSTVASAALSAVLTGQSRSQGRSVRRSVIDWESTPQSGLAIPLRTAAGSLPQPILRLTGMSAKRWIGPSRRHPGDLASDDHVLSSGNPQHGDCGAGRAQDHILLVVRRR